MASIAARSLLRSARTGVPRFAAAAAKPKASPSPFRIPTQKPSPFRISRSPVEMSFAVESMLPFHTATASALLNSMLSVAPRTYVWTLQDVDDC